MAKSTITPLRQHMIDDMTLRKLNDKTQLGTLSEVVSPLEAIKFLPTT
jgi:hypothetical protein